MNLEFIKENKHNLMCDPFGILVCEYQNDID